MTTLLKVRQKCPLYWLLANNIIIIKIIMKQFVYYVPGTLLIYELAQVIKFLFCPESTSNLG